MSFGFRNLCLPKGRLTTTTDRYTSRPEWTTLRIVRLLTNPVMSNNYFWSPRLIIWSLKEKRTWKFTLNRERIDKQQRHERHRK
ncbi:hypothetical protein OSTOST_24182 [Ostertagia ostertagi]